MLVVGYNQRWHTAGSRTRDQAGAHTMSRDRWPTDQPTTAPADETASGSKSSYHVKFVPNDITRHVIHPVGSISPVNGTARCALTLALFIIGMVLWIGLGCMRVRQLRRRVDPRFLHGDWIDYERWQSSLFASPSPLRPTGVAHEKIAPVAITLPSLDVHIPPVGVSAFQVPAVAVGTDVALDVLFATMTTTELLHAAKQSIEGLLRVDLDFFSAHDLLTGALMESPVAVLLHVKDGAAASAPEFVAQLFDGSLTHTAEQWFAAHLAETKFEGALSVAHSVGDWKDALIAPHVPMPIATVMIVSIRDFRLVHRDCLSLDRAITNIVVATVSVGTGIVVGKLIGGAIGAPLGPAGAAAGAFLGALMGGMSGRSVAESIRREPLQAAQRRLTTGIAQARDLMTRTAADGEQAICFLQHTLRARVAEIEQHCRATLVNEVLTSRQQSQGLLGEFYDRFPAHLERITAHLRRQEREWCRTALTWSDVLWPSPRLAEYCLTRYAFRRARRRLILVQRTYTLALGDASFARDEFVSTFFDQHQTVEPGVLEDVRQLEAACRAVVDEVDQTRERLRQDAEREVHGLIAVYRSTVEAAQQKVALTTQRSTKTLELLREQVRSEARALGLDAA